MRGFNRKEYLNSLLEISCNPHNEKKINQNKKEENITFSGLKFQTTSFTKNVLLIKFIIFFFFN